jgi:hypothetical protein
MAWEPAWATVVKGGEEERREGAGVVLRCRRSCGLRPPTSFTKSSFDAIVHTDVL